MEFKYAVEVWDNDCGKYVVMNGYNTFKEAFESWKEVFLDDSYKHNCFISENGRSIFNGYLNIDSEEPILDYTQAYKCLNII